MGFLVWVVIIIVFLAILGLGWNTFFEGVKKGADKIGITSVIENVTNSGIEVAKNASREIIGNSLGNFIFHVPGLSSISLLALEFDFLHYQKHKERFFSKSLRSSYSSFQVNIYSRLSNPVIGSIFQSIKSAPIIYNMNIMSIITFIISFLHNYS